MSGNCRERARSLFEQRGVDRWGKTVVGNSWSSVRRKLLRLQEEIYCLDSYFETTWELSDVALSHIRSTIRSRLVEVLPWACGRGMLSELWAYERVEARLRECNRFPGCMESYYKLKACDVRLMRTLIVELAPQSCDEMRRRDYWTVLDLAAEISDDLRDLSEDMDTFNGNRFLIGVGCRGGMTTLWEMKALLRVISSRLSGLGAIGWRREEVRETQGVLEGVVYDVRRWGRHVEELDDLVTDSRLVRARSRLFVGSSAA